MPNFYKKLIQGILIAGYVIFGTPFTWAASFTINNGQTVTVKQEMVDGDTGLIVSGGFINSTAQGITISTLSTGIAITNNGAITSVRDGIQGPGGDNTGAIATVINNGTITTTGNTGDADAVNFGGENGPTLILTNNGTILTTGILGAEAVLVGGENNTIINNGTIDTFGETSDAITFGCENCGTITNNGTIITRGNTADPSKTGRAHGIFFLGGGLSLTINNTGSIITEGLESRGILINNGAAVIINNSGLIQVSDSTTEAINGGNGVETLNLQSGSQIIGIIDLNAGTDIVNISGANNSSTLTLTDVENINLINGNGLLVGDVVTMVDPTGQSVSSAVLSTTNLAVHNVVNQRLAHNQVLKPIQVATSELTSGMVFQKRAPQLWGSALGAMRERNLEGIALGYDHNYVGFTGGYEASFYKARIGLFGGFVRSTVKTTGDKFGRLRSVDTDTDSFFVGAYGQYFLGGINLTTALMAGYEDHENDRAVVDNLNGFETAQADFSSFFISPSLTLSAPYRVGEQVELRPSMTFTYSGGWYEDYAESGTTRSDLLIDDRKVHALTGQLQLAAAYSFFEDSELEFRAGAKARYTDDDDIDVTLAGTDFRIPHASDSSVYGGYLGANLRVTIVDRMNLVADVEHGRAGGGEEHIAAMLKLEGVF